MKEQMKKYKIFNISMKTCKYIKYLDLMKEIKFLNN